MSGSDTPMREGGVGGRFSPGIRMKLFGFLLPLVFLLIVTVAFAVTEITEFALRRDLLQQPAQFLDAVIERARERRVDGGDIEQGKIVYGLR